MTVPRAGNPAPLRYPATRMTRPNPPMRMSRVPKTTVDRNDTAPSDDTIRCQHHTQHFVYNIPRLDGQGIYERHEPVVISIVAVNELSEDVRYLVGNSERDGTSSSSIRT